MKEFITTLILLFTLPLNACPVHTLHRVSSTQGAWQARLSIISESGEFVDQDCREINDFDIAPERDYRFGLKVTDSNTFDMAYTLTLSRDQAGFTSPTCVFVVTAKGPAIPDVNIIAYNGAICRTSHVDTLDFIVTS